jgi:tRNA U54 and U55 pseudouridine synthase Pus10
LSGLNINNLLYFDECGVDLNIQKEYGYGKKEERLLYDKIEQRFDNHSLTILSCINNNNNKYIAPFTFEGNTDMDVFMLYCQRILILELKKIRKHKLKNEQIKLKEKLTLILDSVSFQKSKEITELFEKNRIILLDLLHKSLLQKFTRI